MIRTVMAALTVLLAAHVLAADAETRLVDAPPAPPPGTPKIWPSEAPAGCPLVASATLMRLGFTGRHVEYGGADTWYLCWAADDKMCTPWTDGGVNGVGALSIGQKATTGHAVVTGDDPFKLRLGRAGIFASDPTPYRG